ncbi:substrate-binding domain-containing protein [Stetteria hydrogenophila]
MTEGSAPPPRFTARFRVVVEANGEPVLDDTLASILEYVERHGSILGAARSLGVPYSRAWEAIGRAERILGARLVEARRGGRRGGGARLTPLAARLLEVYRSARARLEPCLGSPLESPRAPAGGEPELVVAHSSDPVLEAALERLRGEGVRVEAACVGSGLALEALSLGGAHVACAHLLDPETGEYNRPYLERLWVPEPRLLGGWERRVVLALDPSLEGRYSSFEEALRDLAEGRLTLAPRNRGSGTAALLGLLLRRVSRDPRPRPAAPEAYTHDEAARRVASGRAQAALVLQAAAERYGLPWIHAAWERYECYTTAGNLRLPGVEGLRGILGSPWLRGLLERTPGYRPLRER